MRPFGKTRQTASVPFHFLRSPHITLRRPDKHEYVYSSSFRRLGSMIRANRLKAELQTILRGDQTGLTWWLRVGEKVFLYPDASGQSRLIVITSSTDSHYRMSTRVSGCASLRRRGRRRVGPGLAPALQ